MENLNVLDGLKYLGEIWFEKKGLITALILANIFLLVTFDIQPNFYFLIPTLSLLIIASWAISTKPQIAKKDKIGFLVCLDCTEDKEAKKVSEDFIRPLKKLVADSDIGSKIDFIVAPQWIAKNITTGQEAEALRSKSNAQFMIYGNVRLRVINGKEHHVTELDGIVVHRATTKENSSEIVKEFSALLPRKLKGTSGNPLIQVN